MLLINLSLKTGICRSARRRSQQPKLLNCCRNCTIGPQTLKCN